MSSDYTHQAAATKKFGIVFRSKLEAAWAYAFSELKDVNWDYVDSPWHDFVIHAPWGEARIEVKPIGEQFFLQAIERIPIGETLFIVQGEPVSNGESYVQSEADVRCVLRRDDEYLLAASWDCFEPTVLQAMWFAAHSSPIAKIDPIYISQLRYELGK